MALTRHADEFVVMVKGTRAQTEEIKAEIADYVRSKMRMELSLEKTHITHRTKGFVFLGIQIRYGASRNRTDKEGKGRENVYYLAAPKAISRYKAKVRELTSSATYPFKDVEAIRALDRFILGWAITIDTPIAGARSTSWKTGRGTECSAGYNAGIGCRSKLPTEAFVWQRRCQ
jgi:RNA-directed DNA polymerase